MEFDNKRTIKLPESEFIFDSHFHPDKEGILAVGTIDGDVHVLRTDTKDDPFLITLSRHHKGSSIRQVEFSIGDSGNLLLSAAKTVKIYDLDSCKTIRKIDNSKNKTSIYSMRVIDNFLLATGDDEGYFRLWDYRVNRGSAMELHACTDYISDMDILPDNRTIVTTSGEGTLTAYNIRSKKMVHQSELFDSGLNTVRVLPSKGKVIVGCEDGAINIFNIGEWGNLSDRFPLEMTRKSSVDKLEVLGHGTMIAVGTGYGETKIVSLFPHKCHQTLFQHDCSVESLSVQESTNSIASIDTNVIHLAEFKDVSEDEEEIEDSESDSDEEPNKRRGKKSNKQLSNDFFSDL